MTVPAQTLAGGDLGSSSLGPSSLGPSSDSRSSPSPSSPTTASSRYSSGTTLENTSDTTDATSDAGDSGLAAKLFTPRNRASRLHAQRELVDTERSYASDLGLVVDIYIRRSLRTDTRGHPVLDEKDRKVIFGNIADLHRFALKFGDCLSSALCPSRLGSCFLDHLDEMRELFQAYCFNYEASQAKVKQIMDSCDPHLIGRCPSCAPPSPLLICHTSPSVQPHQHPSSSPKKFFFSKDLNHALHPRHQSPDPNLARVWTYFQDCQATLSGKTGAWDLPSLLIKPVQRVLKYALLLDQIINFSDSDQDPQLAKARDGMNLIAASINESKHRQELVKSILKSQRKFKYILKPPLLMGPNSATARPIKRLGNMKQSLHSLKQLPTALRTSVLEFKRFVVSSDRLSEAFKAVYLMESAPSRPQLCHGQGNLDDHIRNLSLALRGIDRYQEFVLRAGLRGPLKYLNTRLEKEVIPKIKSLGELYEGPIRLVESVLERIPNALEAEQEIEKMEEIKEFDRLSLRVFDFIVGHWVKIRSDVSFDMMALTRRAIESQKLLLKTSD